MVEERQRGAGRYFGGKRGVCLWWWWSGDFDLGEEGGMGVFFDGFGFCGGMKYSAGRKVEGGAGRGGQWDGVQNEWDGVEIWGRGLGFWGLRGVGFGNGEEERFCVERGVGDRSHGRGRG